MSENDSEASAPLSPAASEIRRIADNVLHDHMPPDAFKEAAERLARYVLSLSPTPAPRWRDRQKPGTCGMKMVELADAAPYWSRDELYNLATSIYLSENRDKLRELIHQLAAQLYEARSEAAVSAVGSPQPPSEWPPSDGNAWVAPPRSPGETS